VGENHSLARPSHVAVCGCPEGTQLVSVETEDDNDHNREARVVLNLEEECRSRFENFDLGSESNSTEDTVDEGGDP
jgi:hypothetical protein